MPDSPGKNAGVGCHFSPSKLKKGLLRSIYTNELTYKTERDSETENRTYGCWEEGWRERIVREFEMDMYTLLFIFFYFFFFYLWWILSYIEMKQPWVYMCSPSRSPLPPPSPPAHSRFSHCTRSERLSHASNLGW